MIKFVNVVGKIEADGEVNTKFISAELDWDEVLVEYNKSKGYAVNEIHLVIDGEFIGEIVLGS